MSALSKLFKNISRNLRIFFFKNDVLRSSRLRGDEGTIANLYRWFAPIYDWIFPHFQSFQDVIDRLNEGFVDAQDRVLDLGAGTGIVSLQTALKARHVVAFDLQEKMLLRAVEKARAQGLSEKIAVCQGAATILPFGEGVFDSVISSFMEVYLDIPDKIRMLEEVNRVLVPGGRVTFISGVGELSDRYILKGQWEEILTTAGLEDFVFEDHHDVYRLVGARKPPVMNHQVTKHQGGS